MKLLSDALNLRIKEYTEDIINSVNPLEKEYWMGRLDEAQRIKDDIEACLYDDVKTNYSNHYAEMNLKK